MLKLRSAARILFLCSLPALVSAAPDTNEFFIDQTSIDSYRQYVVGEALPLVQSGQWVLEVHGDVSDEARDDDFLKKSFSAEEVLSLLRRNRGVVRIASDFDATTFEGYAASYSLRGMFARVFPGQLENKKFAQQDFRERVTLSYSADVPPSRWLTYRFLESEKDVVFFYSPVLKKVRRITPSNRTDLIFGTEMNLNDLGGSSQKVEDLTFGSISPVILAAPMIKSERPKQVQSNCEPLVESLSQGRGEERSAPAAPLKTSSLLGAGWLPAAVTYHPTKLLRVEATVQDPYAIFHQVILYVSAEDGTVPYKIALNRQGEPQKFTLSVSEDLDGVPYMRSIAVKNLQSDRATLMNFKSYSLCSDTSAEVLLEDFTPAALDPSSVPAS